MIDVVGRGPEISRVVRWFGSDGPPTLVIEYARTSTGAGMTSGAQPCTLNVDILDASTAKGTFSCPRMTLIQGEAVGSADISGTFEAHK